MKPYACKHCKKSFSQSSNCKQHERTHTGEKPYTCKHCKKRFKQFKTCKEHERIHTGVKPYTCKHCKKCFSQSSNCKRHEENHAVDRPLKHKQCFEVKIHLQKQEPSTHSGKKSCMLLSSTEENLSQVESLTCWICQEEISSEACLIQHYNDHMR